MVNESAVSSETSHTQLVHRRRRAQDDDDEAQRAARVMSLVQVGELSAARQALEDASLASRTLATLRALSDPERRPPVPSKPNLLNNLSWKPMEFLTCLRKARRGAAPDPPTTFSHCSRVKLIPSSSHGWVPCWLWHGFCTSFWRPSGWGV